MATTKKKTTKTEKIVDVIIVDDKNNVTVEAVKPAKTNNNPKPIVSTKMKIRRNIQGKPYVRSEPKAPSKRDIHRAEVKVAKAMGWIK